MRLFFENVIKVVEQNPTSNPKQFLGKEKLEARRLQRMGSVDVNEIEFCPILNEFHHPPFRTFGVSM